MKQDCKPKFDRIYEKKQNATKPELYSQNPLQDSSVKIEFISFINELYKLGQDSAPEILKEQFNKPQVCDAWVENKIEKINQELI